MKPHFEVVFVFKTGVPVEGMIFESPWGHLLVAQNIECVISSQNRSKKEAKIKSPAIRLGYLLKHTALDGQGGADRG